MNIDSVLKMIADQSGLNVVLSNNVIGTVTVKLDKVSVIQALDSVLKANNYLYAIDNNIITVYTYQDAEQQDRFVNLQTKVFALNYTDVSDLKKVLLSMKTARGRIETNEKNNQVIVTDTPEKVKEIATGDPLRCADPVASVEMAGLIQTVAAQGDSIGGLIECLAVNVPPGLGEPVFDTLDGAIAKAMLAIPAVKGVEFGTGFAVSAKRGSENNDPYGIESGRVVTVTNNAGGVLGGISSGMPVVVRVAVKPTPSISMEQETVDLGRMAGSRLAVHGRHDACIVPRAVPVVEAMMAVTLCDFALRAGMIPGVVR